LKKREIFIAYLLETPNFLSIFIFPIFLISTSPILLDISKELHISLVNIGFIFSFLIIGDIVGELTSFLYNIKFRKFVIILASYFILIPITVSFIFVTKLYFFYILYFISGYILGVVWIQANAFLLESRIENKNRLINISLIFFPFGAAVAPLINTFISILNLNWRYLYILIIVIIILTVFLYIVMKRNTKNNPEEYIEKKGFKSIFINNNYNRIFIITSLILFFYGIAEAIIFTWSPTFFRIDKALSPVFAGLTLTIFWSAVSVGRIIISTVLCKLKPYIMVIGLSLLSLFSLFFMIFFSKGFMVFITIGLVGLGYSGIFSLIFSTGSLIYKKGKSLLETILFAVSAIGASLVPYLTGITSKLNIKFSMSIALIAMILIILLLLINIINYKRFVGNQNVC
jgi:FHS family glucose/mannose:H+ symporter-like MFS transporter